VGSPVGGVTYEQGKSGPGGAVEAPRAPGPPRLPRKRRRGMFALAALLVCVGALGAVYVVTSLTHRTAVVVMRRDVAVGVRITAGDVGTSMVSVDGSVATIPGEQLGEVLGKTAGVDLRHGTILAASELTGALTPGQGQQVVPVALTPSQLPARGLAPGEQVRVVVTQGSQAQPPSTSGDAGAAKTPGQDDTPATVVDPVGQPDADGKVVVDLLVAAEVGPSIAREAASGRIALVISPRRP
jgi:hypothetical protein